MVALNLQYDIINNTPANASQVEANFNAIELHVNQEVVNRDGSVAMTGLLRLSGDPVNDLDASTKSYSDRLVPIGTCFPYAGAAAPLGGTWMLCNGAALDPDLYPALFTVIGNTYGTSGGLFKLPDLRDRFPIGAGTTYARGDVGGTADAVVVSHTHAIDHDHPVATTTSNDGAHTHTIAAHQHDITHQHTGATAVDGNHLHDYEVRTDMNAGGSSGMPMISNNTGNVAYRTTKAAGSGGNIGDHNHAFTTNFHSGNSSSVGLTTDSALGAHTHDVDLPALTGPSGSTGVSGTGANLPPYLGLNWIIKVA